MSEPSPLDRLLDGLLDVAVYAPLGLALRAKEEIPRLAAVGRQQFDSQSNLARMVGRMAVAQGRRQVHDLLDRRPGAPTAGATTEPAAAPVAPADDTPGADAEPEPLPTPESAAEPGAAPDAGDLPIPGYDSLSASQVVQRLPGLSGDELEAVRAYEQAGRGRKTVLLRVAQLRAGN